MFKLAQTDKREQKTKGVIFFKWEKSYFSLKSDPLTTRECTVTQENIKLLMVNMLQSVLKV